MVSVFANLVNIRSRKMEDVLNHNHDNAGIRSEKNASNRREKMLATGSVIGAVIASSCCIVPLILVSLGISGTWIGSLTALEPYKPIFLSLTGFVLAAGFWHVYFKPKPVCEDESYCARPISGVVTQFALWIATVIAVLSATINFWAPLFY